MLVGYGRSSKTTSVDLSLKGANYYRNSERERREENCRSKPTDPASLTSTVLSFSAVILPIYERDVSVDDILCSHQAGGVMAACAGGSDQRQQGGNEHALKSKIRSLPKKCPI